MIRDARQLFAALGTLAAAGYGGLKLAWALGSDVGFDGAPPWETGRGAWAGVSAFERFLLFEGTAALAVLAAAILLALVRPWGRKLPRRPLRALAWLGAAVMLTAGGVGTGTVLAAAAGLTDHRDELSLWVFGYVYGCFLVLGVAFAATAWLTRGDRAAARATAALAGERPRRRWVAWVTWIAILAPLPYSASRLLWAAGIPFAIREESLAHTLELPGWNSLAVLLLVALAEGTAVFVHVFVRTRARTVPGWIPALRGRRVRPWIVIAFLLAPIALLAGFDHWSLQYILDGFAVPPEVAQDLPAWSFWGQVALFWIWGLSLAVATAAYAWDQRPTVVQGRQPLEGAA